MILFISTHKVLTGLIWFLIACSVGIQVLMGVNLQKLLEELDKPSGKKNTFLKQCKVRPERINLQQHADKCMEGYHIGPFTITGLKHLAGQAMMLSIVLCGIGVCIGLVRGETLGSLLPFYVFSMIGLYGYFAVSGVVDLPERQERVKKSLAIYLEMDKENKADKPSESSEAVPEPPEKEKTEQADTMEASEQSRKDDFLELVELMDELWV